MDYMPIKLSKTIRTLIPILLLAILPAIGKAASASEEKSIRQLMADYSEAVHKLDTAALDRMFHKDLIYSHSSGLLQDKAAAIAGLAKGDHKYEYGPMQIAVHGDTAVVRAAITAQYPISKNPTANLSVLLVWVKESGRWQLLARHVTKLANK